MLDGLAEEWHLQAACQSEDPDLWYPAPDARYEAVIAKRICRECPVQPDCLDWALRTSEPYGIWGGLDANERRRLQGLPTRTRTHVR